MELKYLDSLKFYYILAYLGAPPWGRVGLVNIGGGGCRGAPCMYACACTHTHVWHHRVSQGISLWGQPFAWNYHVYNACMCVHLICIYACAPDFLPTTLLSFVVAPKNRWNSWRLTSQQLVLFQISTARKTWFKHLFDLFCLCILTLGCQGNSHSKFETFSHVVRQSVLELTVGRPIMII